jgi:predicted ATPase
VATALAFRAPLVILDNCEQVARPVARLIETLVRKTDDVAFLATSREPLASRASTDSRSLRVGAAAPGSTPRAYGRAAALPRPAENDGEGSGPRSLLSDQKTK